MFKHMDKIVGVVVGHSFVKNVIKYIDRERHRCKMANCSESGATAEILDLSMQFSLIFMRWAYLFEDDHWNLALCIVLAGRPEVMVWNIGSNDICDIIRNFPDEEHNQDMVESLVMRVVNAAKKCRDENGVQTSSSCLS